MNPTQDVVAKAIAGLDDNLKPTDEEQGKGQTEPVAPATSDPETPPEDPKKEITPVDDKGFTAAELDDEPDEPTPPAVAEIDTSGLDAEARYIVDNLPLITTRIKVGDKVQDMQIKSWTQLPEDFEFASKRDEMAFNNAMTAQENRALALQTQFKQGQQTTQNKEFEERENTMIRDDVAALQTEGELPKFKTKLDDPKFDQDPTTQEVQKVMDYMEDRNKQYLAEYNQGRPFRHIGFREAFYMYQRQNPTKPTAEVVEDRERRKVAEDLKGNRGLSSSEIRKPTVRRGTRIGDILDRIDAEW